MMSENFLRKYKLTILGKDGKGVIIQDQHIEFSINLSSGSKLNELDCKIYNLSLPTISVFDKVDATITLEVGYGDNPLSLVFKGDKISCSTKRDGTELITNLLASDGAITVREGRVQVAKAEGVTVIEVIKDIISKGMLEIITVNLSEDAPEMKKVYNRGYSASGGAKGQLDSICNVNNLKWHILQNTTINVFPVTGDVGRKAYVITPTMIKNTPEKTSEEVRQLKEDLNVPKKTGLNLTLQMNPLIVAGSVIKVKGTFNADGNYTVNKVTHDGSYEGDVWDTKIECTAYAK